MRWNIQISLSSTILFDYIPRSVMSSLIFFLRLFVIIILLI